MERLADERVSILQRCKLEGIKLPLLEGNLDVLNAQASQDAEVSREISGIGCQAPYSLLFFRGVQGKTRDHSEQFASIFPDLRKSSARYKWPNFIPRFAVADHVLFRTARFPGTVFSRMKSKDSRPRLSKRRPT